MSSRAMPAIAERQPTPQPSSAVTASAPAAITSREDLPREWRDDPFVAYVLALTPEEDAHDAARSEAAEQGRRLYGDESGDAWLAALRDGTHPLCRVPEPTRS
jgi:hypothetical protein